MSEYIQEQSVKQEKIVSHTWFTRMEAEAKRLTHQKLAMSVSNKLVQEKNDLKSLHLKAAQERWRKIELEEQRFEKIKTEIRDKINDRRESRSANRDLLFALYKDALEEGNGSGAALASPARRGRKLDPNATLQGAISCYFSGPESSEIKDVTTSLRAIFLSNSAPLVGLSVEQVEEKFKRIFIWIDKDGSGNIDASELGQALDRLGVKVSHRDLLRLMTHLDKESKGFISMKDFVGFGRELVNSNVDVSGSCTKKAALKADAPKHEISRIDSDRVQRLRREEEAKVKETVAQRKALWASRRQFVIEATEAYEKEQMQIQAQLETEKKMIADRCESRLSTKSLSLQDRWKRLEEHAAVKQEMLLERHLKERSALENFEKHKDVKIRPLSSLLTSTLSPARDRSMSRRHSLTNGSTTLLP